MQETALMVSILALNRKHASSNDWAVGKCVNRYNTGLETSVRASIRVEWTHMGNSSVNVKVNVEIVVVAIFINWCFYVNRVSFRTRAY